MIKRHLILFGLLLQTLFSFSQQQNWEVYMAQYQKGPGSTLINMSLKETAPMKQFPYLLTTGVKFIDCSNEGLPVKAGLGFLNKISDTIKNIIDLKLKNIAAGTFTYQCERIDYYYLADTTGIRKLLGSAYELNFPEYEYSISIRNDKEWNGYLTFLYPNEVSYEYMVNQKVLTNLTNEGDDLSEGRKVDHWLFFKTDSDRSKFIAYAEKQKFKIESENVAKESKLKYPLQISRTDNVDIKSISAITMALRKKAKELNGEYDGWETVVVKQKP
jgi:hypothetical protein